MVHGMSVRWSSRSREVDQRESGSSNCYASTSNRNISNSAAHESHEGLCRRDVSIWERGEGKSCGVEPPVVEELMKGLLEAQKQQLFQEWREDKQHYKKILKARDKKLQMKESQFRNLTEAKHEVEVLVTTLRAEMEQIRTWRFENAMIPEDRFAYFKTS